MDKTPGGAGEPLQYDYAKDTDIPRINLSKLQKDSKDSEIPMMKLNTLPKSEGDGGKPELKYDYAKDTDIPRINLNALPKSKSDVASTENHNDSATDTKIPNTDGANDGFSNPTYHTLEEQTPPHYSILEEPECESKPLVSGTTKIFPCIASCIPLR